MALRIKVHWFTEWTDFSLERGWVGWMNSARVIDWGQIGNEAITETEASRPRTSLGDFQRKSEPAVSSYLRAGGYR